MKLLRYEAVLLGGIFKNKSSWHLMSRESCPGEGRFFHLESAVTINGFKIFWNILKYVSGGCSRHAQSLPAWLRLWALELLNSPPSANQTPVLYPLTNERLVHCTVCECVICEECRGNVSYVGNVETRDWAPGEGCHPPPSAHPMPVTDTTPAHQL